MTIGKGTEWGRPGTLPPGSPVFDSDAELFRAVNTIRSRGDAVGAVGLTGGTLWEMIGGATVVGRLHTDAAREYPCDLGRVETDAGRYWFSSFMLARTFGWRRVAVAMNAQNIGQFRFGHRAHPNDGLLDVYEADVDLQQRFLIAKRAKLGAHLPHPQVVERRCATAVLQFGRPRRVSLDGVVIGRSSSVTLAVEPDAMTLVI